MVMMALRRVAAAQARRVTAAAPVFPAPARSFSSESSGIRRPKAIKVKKGEARRRVEPKPKHESSDALVEQHEVSQAPAQYTQNPFTQEPPQTLGGAMKQSFLWGIGMALAFSIVGAVFSIMEETDQPGKYSESAVITRETETEEQ